MLSAFRTLAPVRRGLVCLAGALVAASLIAEGLDAGFPPTAAGIMLSGALCVAALVASGQRFPLYASVAAGVSCVMTGAATQWPHRPEHTFGMLELCVLLLIACRAVRRLPARRGLPLAAGEALAALLLPLRLAPADHALDLLEPFVLCCCLPLAFALGVTLRLRDRLRARDRESVLHAQRLEYARDLHDFVAHHVTAIVTQAKAVRFTSTTLGRSPEPQDLDRMLAGIEDAGSQALASMRGMVSALREGHDAPVEPASVPPGTPVLPDLLTGMAARFSRTGPPAVVTVDTRISGRPLAAGVTDTVHRVVLEALTNVRKHAPTATRVTVTVRALPGGQDREPDRLEVSVTDDGRPADPADRDASGGGFGLVGLAERVEAAGGHLECGRADGEGWRVRSVLPLPPAPAPDRRRPPARAPLTSRPT